MSPFWRAALPLSALAATVVASGEGTSRNNVQAELLSSLSAPANRNFVFVPAFDLEERLALKNSQPNSEALESIWESHVLRLSPKHGLLSLTSVEAVRIVRTAQALCSTRPCSKTHHRRRFRVSTRMGPRTAGV